MVDRYNLEQLQKDLDFRKILHINEMMIWYKGSYCPLYECMSQKPHK